MIRRSLRPRPAPIHGVAALLLALVLAPPVAAREPLTVIASAIAAPERLAKATLTDPVSSSVLSDVLAGGPGFIAVGNRVDQASGEVRAVIRTSVDGATWTPVGLTGAAAMGQVRGIAAIDGGFLAVGGRCCPDHGQVWRSTDGLAWTLQADDPVMADAALFSAAQLLDGSIVTVGCAAVLECGGGLAWRSVDGGLTWSEPVALPGLLLDVTATSFGMVAVGTSQAYDGAPMAASSADGTAWSGISLPGPLGILETAVPSGGGALAVGSSHASIEMAQRSLVALTEGTVWGTVPRGRMRATAFHAAAWLADPSGDDAPVLLAGGSITLADGGSRPAAWWSPDATTWTRMAIGSSRGQVLAMATGTDGTIVAVGWTGRDTQNAAAWSAVAPTG